MNHRIVRLTSGEEILCDLLITGDTYVLKNPVVIIPVGDGNIGLAHWLPYAKNDIVHVSKKAVVFIVDPVQELDAKYNAMLSPIILPPAAGEVTATA